MKSYSALAVALLFIAIATHGCDASREQWEHVKHDTQRIFSP